MMLQNWYHIGTTIQLVEVANHGGSRWVDLTYTTITWLRNQFQPTCTRLLELCMSSIERRMHNGSIIVI